MTASLNPFQCKDCPKMIARTSIVGRAPLRCAACYLAIHSKRVNDARMANPAQARINAHHYYIKNRQSDPIWRETNKLRAIAWRKKNRKRLVIYAGADSSEQPLSV